MARVRNDAGIAEFVALTETKQRALVLEYANNGGLLKRACKTVGMNPIQHHRWKRDDENYKQAFEIADDIATEGLIETLKTVVVDPPSKDKPQPNILGAMFLIKAKRPEYRDNYIASSHSGPIQINITYPSSQSAIEAQAPDNSLSKLVDETESAKLINPPREK